LENSGHEFFGVDNLAAGKASAQSVLPHIIFVDINLNDHSGFEFLSWKMESKLLKDTCVIMMSADAFPSNIKNSIVLGADDFLAKPLINQVVIRKTRKAALNKELKKIVIPEDDKIQLDCIVPFFPLSTESNRMTISSEVRLSTLDTVKVHSDIGERLYKQIGPILTKSTGRGVYTIAVQGDVRGIADDQSTTMVHNEEDLLFSLSPSICILDDDPNFTSLLKIFYERFNSKIKIFNEIEALIAYFHDNSPENMPDLCVIDLSINDKNDSFELIQKIRGDFKDLPILVATADKDGISAPQSVELGASDFIYKPIKLREIYYCIRQWYC
jgi:DNA-binding response OmpR family regulator